MDDFIRGITSLPAKQQTSIERLSAEETLLSLPQLPIQDADFAVWQDEWLQGEDLLFHLNYWKQHLRSHLPLQLPTDRYRVTSQTYRSARQPLNLSKNLTNALKALSQESELTLSIILLAAFQVLLHRYSGQEDIIRVLA